MKSLAFLVLIALFVPALAILPAHAAPALAVQVVYLENNNVITTYDVNPTTGKMTPVGHPLTIEAAQYLGPISSLPNGHFIYILWQDANRENHVSVYATNSWGVPNRSPLQTIGSTRLGRFEVDPDGKFAYALMGWIDAKGELNSNIRLFTIDSGSGKLTESKQIQAHYGPDYYYSADFYGFNSSGSKLYDDYSFSFDHESASIYSYHPVDPKTGKLKPDVTIFKTSDYYSGDNVTISDKLLAQTFASCCDAYVNIYNNPPKYQNGQYVPLIHCTSSMLPQCATAEQSIVDPSSKNLFMPPLQSGDTAVAHIDLTNSVLTQTATIPGWVQVIFSSYSGLLYAANWGYQSNSTITSYLFDPGTGTLTEGDQLVLQGQALYPARRTR